MSMDVRGVSDRGVSPVIATLLLILIAIAAGVAVYVYVTGWVSTATSTTAVTQSQIQVDMVAYDPSQKNLTIWVRNVGGVTANLSAVYLLDSNGTLIKSNTTLQLIQIPPLNVTRILNVTGNVDLISGHTYMVKVVTLDGSTTTYSFRPG